MTETTAEDGNNPQMLKSTDGGATWAEVDGDNRPDARDLKGTYQLRVDSTIYFTVTRGYRVWFFAFRTSDHPDSPDTWSETELVDDDLTSGGVKQASSLAMVADGTFWLTYSDILQSDRQQIAVRKREGANRYGSKITVGSTSGSWTGPRMTQGMGDVTHLLYKDDEDNHLLWRRVGATGELSAAIQIDTEGVSNVPIPHTHALRYEAAGEETLVVAFSGSDDTLKAVTITGTRVGAEEQVSAEPVLQDADVVTNEGAVAHLALDGSTVHAVWVDEGTGDILHRDKSGGDAWGEEQLLWDSGDEGALYVYCTVLRSGNCPRLACTYDVGPHSDDTGNVHYNEFVL